MMYSYTGSRNLYGEITNDTTATNLTNGDLYINSDIGRMLGKKPWPFLFREGTVASVANQQFVEVPANIRKVTSVIVESGTSKHKPREVTSREMWDKLNYTIATAYTADYPTWYYPFDKKVYFLPTFSTARTVTVYGRIGFSRLNIADYTTGTAAATAGSTAIVGGGTSWTNRMAGRWIRLTDSNTAGSGDDEWYEVASVESTTALTLKKPYEGITVTNTSNNYTIGQMSPIPDGYQEAPIFRATSIYYSTKSIPGAADKALFFKGAADDIESQLVSDYGSETDNVVIEDDSTLKDQQNPNLYVRL